MTRSGVINKRSNSLRGVMQGMIPFHRRIPLVRRPFHQRDEAIRERDEAVRERDRVYVERDTLAAELARAQRERDHQQDSRLAGSTLQHTRHRPLEHTAGSAAITEGEQFDDGPLVDRIIAAYRRASATSLGSSDSFWLQSFFVAKRSIHDAIIVGNRAEVSDMLRRPATNLLFHGFDKPTVGEPSGAGWAELLRVQIYDDLYRVSEAVGVRRMANPEAAEAALPPDPEAILKELDIAFGFHIQFPNPYPAEYGLATSRGIASHRAIQGLFQAFRIKELVSNKSSSPRILEIGAGLGRTAYYARQFGLHDYTIIDLPITSVAQAYFLGRSLGPTNINLYGEKHADGVRVFPPAAFLDGADNFDLVVNVDSLTEMAPDTGRAYCEAIKARTGLFLSINHEANPFTVRGICKELGMSEISRTPYWLRRGYVDEVFSA